MTLKDPGGVIKSDTPGSLIVVRWTKGVFETAYYILSILITQTVCKVFTLQHTT